MSSSEWWQCQNVIKEENQFYWNVNNQTIWYRFKCSNLYLRVLYLLKWHEFDNYFNFVFATAIMCDSINETLAWQGHITKQQIIILKWFYRFSCFGSGSGCSESSLDQWESGLGLNYCSLWIFCNNYPFF